MIKQLFKDVREKTLSIRDAQNDPVVKYFDLWNRQLDFLENESPAEYPAVYLELEPISWKTLGLKKQEGVLNFRLHIVTPWLGQTYSTAPDDTSDEQLSYLDIPGIIYKEFQGTSINNTGSIVRIDTIFDHNHEGYIETIEVYQCAIQDTQAMQQPIAMQISPILTRQ